MKNLSGKMRIVTKMTTGRRLSRNLLLWCAAISAVLGAHASAQQPAADFESASTIQQLAEQFALAQISEAGLRDVTARASNLDTRLRLKKCDTALEAFTTSGNGIRARTTIGVRCTGLHHGLCMSRWLSQRPVRWFSRPDLSCAVSESPRRHWNCAMCRCKECPDPLSAMRNRRLAWKPPAPLPRTAHWH